jgi:hypothetical protein
MTPSPRIFDLPIWKTFSSSESLALLALLIRADKSTMKAYPSYARVAADSRLSAATVRRAIAGLESKKAIIVERTITTKIENGRNTVKKRNYYDLSRWRRLCQKPKTEEGRVVSP